MDPRAERSLQSLRESVLRLAGERRIETVTTVELARAAGVTRGTIYNHGKSPAELLEHFLGDELTVLRERFRRTLGDKSVGESFDDGVRGAVGHVVEHLPIYELALAREPSPSVHHVLSDHFAITLADYFRANPANVPVPEGFSRAEHLETTIEHFAAYAAHGVVGTVEVWLRQGPSRNTELLIATIRSLIPQWYFDSATNPHPATQLL